MSDNIELFDLYTAKIFSRLYEAFPRRIGLDAYDLTGITAGEDDWLTLPREVDICRECIWWLQQAGFIWIVDKFQYGATQAVLTPKGLEVLKLIPSSIEAKTSVGEMLLRFAKEGTIEAGKGIMGMAFTEAFKLFSS